MQTQGILFDFENWAFKSGMKPSIKDSKFKIFKNNFKKLNIFY